DTRQKSSRRTKKATASATGLNHRLDIFKKPLAPEVRVAVSEVRAAHRANPSSTADALAPLASSAPQPDAPFARPAHATELATRSSAPFAAWRAPPSALASEPATGCPGLRVRS